jgi:hypothetical protein
MVNLRWDVYNMITIWLMVGILFVIIGLGKSLIGGGMGSSSSSSGSSGASA